MGRFTGQVAFLTGASAGIGAALARELARQGADVALLARREDRLEGLRDELVAMDRRALAIGCDVTKDGDLERAAARTREELGGIDIAIANAGFGVAGELEKLDLDDWRRQLETNVFGVLRTVYATLDAVAERRGRIVVVGSVAGYLARPGGGPYAMSKFAVRALCESITPELAPRGVSVTLISPGFVRSEIRQVDNRGVHHEGARDVVPDWIQMPTDVAARKIARAIYRRKREAVITGHGKLLVRLARHAPWSLDLVARMFKVKGSRPDPGATRATSD